MLHPPHRREHRSTVYNYLSVGTPITKVNFNTHDIGSICFSVFLYEVICILKTYCPLICMHNTNYVIRIVHLVTNYIIRIVHLVLCLKRINIKSVNVCTGNGNSINQFEDPPPFLKFEGFLHKAKPVLCPPYFLFKEAINLNLHHYHFFFYQIVWFLRYVATQNTAIYF